jgi:hypothetical protein
MECQDLRGLQEWIIQWNDLIEFEIAPVLTSHEAQQIVTTNLKPDTCTQPNEQTIRALNLNQPNQSRT